MQQQFPQKMRIQIVTTEQIAQLAAPHSVAAGPAEKHKKAANVGVKSLSRTPSPPATQQQPCRFFAAGLCKHGSACHFSHVAPAPPPLSSFALVPAAPPSPGPGVPVPYSYVAHKNPVAAAVARPRPQAMPCSFATTRCSHQGGSHEQQGQSQQHQLNIMMMLLDKGLSSGKSFEAVVGNSSATFKSL